MILLIERTEGGGLIPRSSISERIACALLNMSRFCRLSRSCLMSSSVSAVVRFATRCGRRDASSAQAGCPESDGCAHLYSHCLDFPNEMQIESTLSPLRRRCTASLRSCLISNPMNHSTILFGVHRMAMQYLLVNDVLALNHVNDVLALIN